MSAMVSRRVLEIKEKAEELYSLIESPIFDDVLEGDETPNPERQDGRAAALAGTKLEESVMWAIKSLTS